MGTTACSRFLCRGPLRRRKRSITGMPTQGFLSCLPRGLATHLPHLDGQVPHACQGQVPRMHPPLRPQKDEKLRLSHPAAAQGHPRGQPVAEALWRPCLSGAEPQGWKECPRRVPEAAAGWPGCGVECPRQVPEAAAGWPGCGVQFSRGLGLGPACWAPHGRVLGVLVWEAWGSFSWGPATRPAGRGQGSDAGRL